MKFWDYRKGLATIFIMIVILSMTGCGEQEKEEPIQDIVELSVVTMGTEPVCGMETFYQELDALTIPDLGITVRITYIPWGDESTKMHMAVESGEYDIMSAGPWSDVLEYIDCNAFINMEPYFESVPKLVSFYQEHMGKQYFEDMRLSGGYYGLTEIYRNCNSNGVLYRSDLCEAWGIEPITSMETLEVYLYEMVEHGYDSPLADYRLWQFLWEYLAGDRYVSIPGGEYCVLDLNTKEVCLQVETEEYQECIELITKWYRDGLVNRRILSERVDNTEALIANGNLCIDLCNHLDSYNRNYIPLIEQEHPEWEMKFVSCYELNEQLPCFSVSTYTSMLCISSRSENVELALKFLEKCMTDERYSRLLMYGVENHNYEIVDGMIDYKNVDALNAHVPLKGGWNYVYEIPMLLRDDAWRESYNNAKNIIKRREAVTASKNPLEGFVVDNSEMQEIILKLGDYESEVMRPVVCGMSTDVKKDIKVMQIQMRELGADKLLSVVSEQVDEWINRDKRETKE